MSKRETYEKIVEVNPAGPGKVTVVSMEQTELVIRLAEALSGSRRPRTQTNEQILDDLERLDPEMFAVLLRQAGRAIDYFAECMAHPDEEQVQ